MAAGEPLETELKFLIEPRDAAKLRAHPLLRGAAPADTLRSAYFDTAEHALAAAGFSLRVRTRAGAHVQTVKSLGGAEGVVRGEWESPVSAARPDPDALAGTPALEALDGAEAVLRPVFSTTVRRETRLWRKGKTLVEISLDEGQVRAGARRARLLEVELELKSGDPAILFDLAGRLRAAVPLRLCLESKAERGYRLARGEAPVSVGAVAAGVEAGQSAAEAFRRIARAALAQVVANAEILRRSRHPEAVHQMRVGLRRLRAALAAFAPLVDGPGGDAVSANLDWLAGELDQARDQDVFHKATLRPAAERARQGEDAECKAFEALSARLNRVREGAYARALGAIHSIAAGDLVLNALRWVEVGDWAGLADPARREAGDQPVRRFAAQALDARMAAVRKRAKHLKSLDPHARHRLRIKAKTLRYAVEFLAPAFDHPGEARRLLSHLGALQDALGELNDIAVSRRKALADAGAEPHLAFAAGRAVGWRERGEDELTEAAAKAAKKLLESAPFWHD